MDISHLKKGSSYLFEHIRKGPFVAVYLGTLPTKETDTQDRYWIEVDVFTEEGSGQERLANAFIRDELGRKMHAPVSRKLIRPSLLRSITSPSSDAQQRMLEQYLRIREAARKRVEAGGEFYLPSLSLPTQQVFNRLDEAPKETKKGRRWPWSKK